MPIYSLQGPDGRIYKVEAPEGAQQSDLIAFVEQQIANQPKPIGMGESIKQGFGKGLESLISSGVTAAGSVFGDPNAAAQAGLERQEQIQKKYPHDYGLEQFKQTYQNQGLFPAAKQFVGEIPSAIAEQAPNIGATIGGGLLGSAIGGARAGAMFGPWGAAIGGGLGAALPSLVQQFGGNIERQAQEQKEVGQPIDINRGIAGVAAVPQAALDVAGTFIPMGGRLVSKITGIPVDALLGRTAAQTAKLAEESLIKTLAKGTATGVLAEVPTEVTQQMLERWQAGLPLTDADAYKEYGETAFKVSMLAPIGAAGRLSERSGAREEVAATAAAEQQKQAALQKAEEDRVQAEKAQREAEALQRLEEYKQTPEYAEEIAGKYQQAEKAKADLLAQIRPVQEGSLTATADKLFNKSIQEKAAAMQPEIDRLAKEYNEAPKPPPLEEQTFTPEQYQQAVSTLASTVKDQQIPAADAVNLVKQTTGIDNDQHASSLLDAAVQQGDIAVDEQSGSVFIPSEKEGLNIEQGFEQKEERPTGFNVVRGNKVVSTFPDEKAAQTNLASVEKTRTNALNKVNRESQLASQRLAESQGLLDNMKAYGKEATPEYAKAVKRHQALEQKVFKKLAELGVKQKELLEPFAIQPAGKKKLGRKTFTVKEQGVAPKKFYRREDAEKHAFAKVSDERLNAIIAKSKAPKLVAKAQEELKRRQQPAAPKMSPVQTAVIKALQDSLSPVLKKFGLDGVSLEMATDIANNAEGSYAAKLIRIALDANNPMRVLRHESIHALKELGFFSPSQWKALEAQAKKVWVTKYLQNKPVDFQGRTISRLEAYKSMGLSQEEILEEAIADAFADFDVNKAPAGFLAATLDKLRRFFAALRNALTGAGFNTAEDIFGKIEGGKLKPSKGLTNQTMQQRFSLLRAAYPDEIEISTQNPQGATRKYDPISQMLSIDSAAVDEAMNANEDIRSRITQAILSYGFIPKDTPPNQALDLFKKNIINNLIFLHNKVPKKIRDRSKLWYDGANVIAQQMADQYDMTLRQVAGIMAAMSPQKDWFQNVSMAERAIDILTNQGDSVWTPEMLQYADSYVNEAEDRKEREKRQEHRDKIQKIADRGVMLKDMNEKDAAAFIRSYDEAFNSRQYRIVTPEGGFGDLVRNNNGTPSTMMWSTYGPIEKTVSIFRDGSRANVSQQLGFEHKIRSFYNNIAAPNSDIGHVTIDTHAVAAALFEALAGTDTEVTQNFGGTGKTDVIGVGGTYGLIADAYREAAAMLKLKPRELQSITWEAVRGLFSEEMKATLKPKVRAEWAKYKNGLQTFGAARRNILRIAGQEKALNQPDWVGSGKGQTVEDGGTSYDKDYSPEGGVRLRTAKELKDRAIVNLSAASDLFALPGIKEIYKRSREGDADAYKLLQDIATNSLQYLLNDTNARVAIKPIKGVYMSNREPAIVAMVTFKESESPDVLARLARFATNYGQEQIHVRVRTNKPLGYDFKDGSYATASYTINLDRELSDSDINDLIAKTGLKAFSVDKDSITTYWVAPNEGSRDEQQKQFQEFAQSVKALNGLVGRGGANVKPRVERLYVYGDGGYGRRIGYDDIQGHIPAKAKPDLNTPRMIAEYLFRNPVKVFKQKALTLDQQNQQKLLARVYTDIPINDLKKPLVRKAYEALNRALVQQFQVLPIKVELQKKTYQSEDEIPAKFKGKFQAGDIIPPYDNMSSEMRRDISENNHLLVYPTNPQTFGPKGSDFSNHPLLKPSGLKDSANNDLLFNDVLRAVHDYYAHGLEEAQFGPVGEYTAWANHMAATADPMARWALTAETRLQNAWQNFAAEHENIPVSDRPFADQKAALPPVNFLLTGDKAVDAPVLEMIQSLNEKQVLGSLKERSKTVNEVRKRLNKASLTASGAKFSLRDKLGMYSELENKIAAAVPQAPVETWKGFIKSLSTKGVKPEEIEWSGVNDFLDLKKGKVTRQEILNHLKEGGVKVEETVLGDTQGTFSFIATDGRRRTFTSMQEAQKDFDAELKWIEEDSAFISQNDGEIIVSDGNSQDMYTLTENDDGTWDDDQGRTFDDEDAALEAAQKIVDLEKESLRETMSREVEVDDSPNQTEYNRPDLVLPGGENYREVLLTLPPSTISPAERAELDRINAINRRLTEEEADRRSQIEQKITDLRKDKYRSSHWDQPNILAHIRLNDRTDADGKKVLFVEEIQSDWGQEGKKRGFVSGDWEAPYKEWERGLRERAKSFYLDVADTDQERETAIRMGEKLAAREDLGSIASVMGERQQMSEAWSKAVAMRDRVPTAPFVSTKKFAVFKDGKELTRVDKDGKKVKQRYSTLEDAESAAKKVGGKARSLGFQENTEGWLNLALKRIMVMAAEGGYDKVAFVNGDQSVNRYDLSKQVNKIVWNEKTGDLAAQRSGGDTGTIKHSGVTKDKLSDIIGKEPAQKLIDAEEFSGWRSIEGDDLKVGGEGMKTFYDKIVPLTLKKLLPKVGGGQIQSVTVQQTSGFEGNARKAPAKAIESNQPGFDITPAMRDRVQTTGLPRFSLREAPNTPEFKRWFGDSKVVDENGKPMVVYHGTGFDFDAFEGARKGTEKAYFFSKNPELAGDFATTSAGAYDGSASVMPVYLSMQNPLVIDYKGAVKWGNDSLMKQMLDQVWSGKHDGVIANNVIDGHGDPTTIFAVVRPAQIKSAIGNRGTYDPTNPDIRYSLRAQILATPNGQAIMGTVDSTTVARREQGFIERFFSWLAPDNFSKLRQETLNRYEALSVNEKRLAKTMGGIERLADSNAESAALMSDLAAGVAYSAFGVDDKVGGIPVYRNGHTYVSNENGTVKGAFAIFAPLAKYNDPLIYQLWQTWAGAKRASRFLANGQEKNYTAAEIAHARQLGTMYPEFQSVHDEWIKYNDGLVKYLVDTGVLSEENGRKFREHSDYVPFYRQLDGEETIGPQVFQALSNVKPPKKIKHSEETIADFFETIVRNTQAAIQAGMKNMAAVKAVETSEVLGDAQKLNTVTNAPNTVTVLKNGLQVSYRVEDMLFLDAMKSLNMSEIPFLSIIAAPANLLRSLVTKEPGFIIANMMRDSLSAYATSGVKMTNIAGVVSNFGKDLFGRSSEAQALRGVGIGTGYEFSQGPKAGGQSFKESLMAKSKQSVTGMPVRGIKSLWGHLEKMSEASDLATRVAVYKDTLARTGNEAEAKFRALEVMNFNRRGRSPAVRLLTAAIPFLNARMQGLDVFYRAGIRPFFSNTNPTSYEKQVQKAFIQRGLLMASISVMYAAMMSGDEDYEKQEEETKDNYWLLPSLGIKIPIPHEVGFLFKTIPERIYRASFGSDTTKDLGKSLYRNMTSTLAFNPIPQAVLPVTEAMTNYSFFTGRSIVGSALSGVAPEFQVGPSTSLLSKQLGESTGLSPMKIDHILKGYTGTMGMYMADVMDSVIDSYSDVKQPSKRFEQTPVLRRFLMDPEARGNVTAYYDLKDSVDETVRTINLLEKTGNPELRGYMEENAKKFAIKGYVNNLNEQMKSLQEKALLVRSSTLKPDEKRDMLKEIGKAQSDLSNNIKYVRKLVTED